MTPESEDFARIRRERLPLVCDNHWVRDIPPDIPAVGFQHGVAWVKAGITHNWKDYALALRQARAAHRPNTLWVACAEWISSGFQRLHGNRAAHVVYHPVDVTRFDGRLDNAGSRLVLHDARSLAKGKQAIEWLVEALPEYRFEALACQPAEVPDRMRRACAFVHLSRYEGNSIVCNEAMASDLPCLFSRVGLMRDRGGPSDVAVLEAGKALTDRATVLAAGREFLASLERRSYRPRAWVMANASPSAALRGWSKVVEDLDQMWLRS
jgi:hypothetical protein